MTTSRPAPAIRHSVAATVCAALVVLISAAPASPAGGLQKPLGGCTVRPSAESMALGDALLDAWRIRNGASEILHDVHCSDGRFQSVWITADII